MFAFTAFVLRTRVRILPCLKRNAVLLHLPFVQSEYAGFTTAATAFIGVGTPRRKRLAVFSSVAHGCGTNRHGPVNRDGLIELHSWNRFLYYTAGSLQQAASSPMRMLHAGACRYTPDTSP